MLAKLSLARKVFITDLATFKCGCNRIFRAYVINTGGNSYFRDNPVCPGCNGFLKIEQEIKPKNPESYRILPVTAAGDLKDLPAAVGKSNK